MNDDVTLTKAQWKVIKILVDQLSSAFDNGPELYQEWTGISVEEFDQLVAKLHE